MNVYIGTKQHCLADCSISLLEQSKHETACERAAEHVTRHWHVTYGNCTQGRYVTCENRSLQDNSPPLSCHWYWCWKRADLWNGRHEPVTTQHSARQSLVSLTFCLIAVATDSVVGQMKSPVDLNHDFSASANWFDNTTIFNFSVLEFDAGFDLNKHLAIWFN